MMRHSMETIIEGFGNRREAWGGLIGDGGSRDISDGGTQI